MEDNAIVLIDTTPMKNLIVTYDGETGDYPEPIPADIPSNIILENVEKAIQNGDIAVFGARPNVSLTDYVVDRTGTSIVVRPKTSFG